MAKNPLNSFLDKFKEEANDILARLNQGLMDLESSPGDAECLQEITRAAHTLKGAANMMGFTEIGKVAHRMEDILSLVRDGERPLSPRLSDALFAALDNIQSNLEKGPGEESDDTSGTDEMCEALARFIEEEPLDADTPSEKTAPSPEPQAPAPEEALPGPDQPAEPDKPPASKPDMSQFMAAFRGEAAELLERLNLGLVGLEENPDDKSILEDITRAAHTMKGSSKMMGLDHVGTVAHRMEDLLKGIRDGHREMADEVSDALFASIDMINSLVNEESTGRDNEIEELCGLLESYCNWDENAATANRPPQAERASPAPAGERKKPVPPPRAMPEPAEESAPNRPEPTADPAPVPRTQRPTKGKPSSATKAFRPPAVVQETIRVDTGKVDKLVNLAGEMVVNQIRFTDRLTNLKRVLEEVKAQQRECARIREQMDDPTGYREPEDNDIPFERIEHFAKSFEEIADSFTAQVRQMSDDTAHLALGINELQQEVMSLRMVPIGSLFDTYRRTVRDLAREMGKEVQVVIEGRETELDKKMIEGINEPLVHLVRNCIDHGFESPGERAQTGKPTQGTLTLSARQEGDRILIEISDDGQGMSPDFIKQKAVAKGVITEEEAAKMSHRDALYLIFHPNFSTRDKVSQTSGRGVGMDVVKSNTEALKGEVRVHSEFGVGSKFTLILPLTLAVTRALFVRVGEMVFAIQASAIDQVARLKRSAIRSIERREAIQVRDRTVPLVALADVLSMPYQVPDDLKVISLVILHYAEDQIAFIVDEIVGEQEIVIKNLGEHLSNVPNVAGGALIGSGEVILILHVPDLFSSIARAARRGAERTFEKLARDSERRTILVVEDVLTIRELEKNLLQAHGYEVTTAPDGYEGLQQAADGDFDLIVADVSMPNMNGFEMMENMRKDPHLRNTPVVLVTSLEKEEDRRRGFELGAEAFVVKTAFDQTNLLDTIRRLLA